MADEEEKTVNDLKAATHTLNLELVSSVGKNEDWIVEQYQLIQKRQQLAELERKLKMIHDYADKIENMRNKIKEKEKKIIFKGKTNEDTFLNDGSNEEPDDFLLVEEEIDGDEEPPEDENDVFTPLQIFFCSRTHSQLSQLVGEVIYLQVYT